ncbi:MAG: glycosyltransferase family 1 protein [Chloroflexi bacterium]|nr:glycosyltransferase family 1 protein [Chloroflexota bacterium]
MPELFPPGYRVGLNAHLLSLTQTYRGAGINGYIYQLLRHLPAADGGFAYAAYLHDPRFEAPNRLTVRRSRWDTRSPWRRIAWEQTRLAVESRGLALLHGLAYATPLAAACPTVVTVHDLSFLRFPEAFRPFNRYYLGFITRISTRRAARVIAVSESTRQDVIALCGVAPERVVVVPNGVTEAFCPAPPDAVAEFRRRKGLPERFILYLGTLEPRKNLARLVEAYALWRNGARSETGPTGAMGGSEGVKLVIAGAKGWYYEQIFARVRELGLGDDVIFPGFVPADELPFWYRAAELFVYPSLFEGFGLPVLEALACGAPVVTSAASALPEVAGEAALLANPEDTAALANAIGRAMGDPVLREQLAVAGPRQAARFSWSRTAVETAAVYRAALGLPAPDRRDPS